MTLPVSALKDDELLHYAPLDSGAAAELQRRLSEGSIDPGAEVESLRDDIRHIESSLDDQHEQIENLSMAMSQAAALIRLAMNPETDQVDADDLLAKALRKLEQ